MRFVSRSLMGIALLAMTLGLLAFAAGTVYRAAEDRSASGNRNRPQAERVFSVNVLTVMPVDTTPVITAFGEVESGRSLELRATAPGRVIGLAKDFREGGAVAADTLLFQIDPADAQARFDIATAEIVEARAEVDESAEALLLAREDLVAAEAQLDLRVQAVERQTNLAERGAGTAAAVESATLSLALARQAVVGRKQALATAEARIHRADVALRRAEIDLSEAERALRETAFTAPWAGLISEVSAVEGRLVGQNEKLGILIDPAALEIAFRVSNAQFARLIDQTGALRSVSIEATLALDDIPITVRGEVDRAGAQVGEGQTGRLLFARLQSGSATALRPGDFVTVQIDEPSLQNVAIIPATAATNDGRILVLAEEDRLEEMTVNILRRQGDMLIVDGAPEGREMVAERLPQLGTGVKIRPIRAGAEMAAAEMVTLTPERRALLIAAVEANQRMPAEARARLLTRLQQETVPAETVNRLEARMARRSGAGTGPSPTADPPQIASGSLVALEPARQARLIAFVEANERISEDAKRRILGQLATGEAPPALVERLESRIGG